jgi:hypothetical protein
VLDSEEINELVAVLTLCAVLETKDSFSGMGRETLEILGCFKII